ncbi:MAG TPA: SIMPL domain-containing protein [Candidatus Absconditabacterales bacterium]|nr:SIMPL domain-containing protein [Candidatus Absconditabacterales bacterium]HPK28167.1 SIMPL domain-containing protein [Candidatus Absconditabacterales bacterium]
MKKGNIISLIVICVTILVSGFLLTKTKFYIQSVGSSMADNTITVEGEGKVMATPDTIILSVNIEETKKSTAEAQKAVNTKVNQIKDLIKKYKIKDSDIQSRNISVYPEYNYTNAGRKFLGYRANHSLDIKIKSANIENEGVGGSLIDEVANIGGVIVENIAYDIEDKTPYYSQARKLAMEKAYEKAKELAKIAGVKLLKPISISESLFAPTAIYSRNSKMMMMDAVTEVAGAGSISLGEMEINITVNVLYGIQ